MGGLGQFRGGEHPPLGAIRGDCASTIRLSRPTLARKAASVGSVSAASTVIFVTRAPVP
jgi:hypothetical protein